MVKEGMDSGPGEIITGLVMMLTGTNTQTEIMAKQLKLLKDEQTSVHPLVIERVRLLSLAIGEAMDANATAFDIRPDDTERRIRSELDNAFRAQRAILDEIWQMPPRNT